MEEITKLLEEKRIIWEETQASLWTVTSLSY